MIYAFWNKINYFTELFAACMVFILPVQKKENIIFRIIISFLFLAILNYLLISLHKKDALDFPLIVVYWLFYSTICIFLVWFTVNGSWTKILFLATCAFATQHIAFDYCRIYNLFLITSPVILFLTFLGVYLFVYHFFAKKLSKFHNLGDFKKRFIPMITIIGIVWILSIVESHYAETTGPSKYVNICYLICDGLCCTYILWVNIGLIEKINLQQELETISQNCRQQAKQYQISSDVIENLNIKCHDLRHQIQAFRNSDTKINKEKIKFLDTIENDIRIYDTTMSTGNKPLDTILMKYGLYCKKHSIQWTCLADGSKLNFMSLEDLYALFDNAFENAVDAVLKLKNLEKRIINVNIRTVNKLIEIQIQNYFTGDIKITNELPETIKKDKRNHGYGLKSIKYTAEKYNGTITISTENEIFNLQILIPFV